MFESTSKIRRYYPSSIYQRLSFVLWGFRSYSTSLFPSSLVISWTKLTISTSRSSTSIQITLTLPSDSHTSQGEEAMLAELSTGLKRPPRAKLERQSTNTVWRPSFFLTKVTRSRHQNLSAMSSIRLSRMTLTALLGLQISLWKMQLNANLIRAVNKISCFSKHATSIWQFWLMTKPMHTRVLD